MQTWSLSCCFIMKWGTFCSFLKKEPQTQWLRILNGSLTSPMSSSPHMHFLETHLWLRNCTRVVWIRRVWKDCGKARTVSSFWIWRKSLTWHFLLGLWEISNTSFPACCPVILWLWKVQKNPHSRSWFTEQSTWPCRINRSTLERSPCWSQNVLLSGLSKLTRTCRIVALHLKLGRVSPWL